MKHSNSCGMAFGRYTKLDGQCPRCDELKNGAAPKAGWQTKYFAKKKQDEENFYKSLRAHNCQASNCGPVCTFGDW